MCSKVPDMMEDYLDKIPALLSDRNHGVLLSAIACMCAMCEQNPKVRKKFRKQIPKLLKLLNKLFVSQMPVLSFFCEFYLIGISFLFFQNLEMFGFEQ